MDEVKALLVDQHVACLWIGTTGAGVARYQDGKLSYFRRENGLISDNVLSLLERPGKAACGVATQEGLSQLTDLKLPIYSRGEGLIRGTVHSVLASKNGGFWYTTGHGFGYFDGKTSVNYTNDGFLPNYYMDPPGFDEATSTVMSISLTATKTSSFLPNGKISALITNSTWPTDICEDQDGVVVGLGAALYHLRDGKTIPFVFKDGKGPEFYWINNLRVARDGAIWVASQNGLARIKDGEFKLWSNVEVGPSPKTAWVGEDEDGTIWAGMTAGIGHE